MTNRRLIHGCVAFGGAAALLMVFADTASAHVTVSADGATSGGSDQVIAFQVPTESETASTVGFKLQLPTDTPIASVMAQPLPGWSFTETTTKLATPIKTDDGDITEAVSEIDWKADNKAAYVAPGQFQQFVVIAGLLPSTSKLVFRAIQNYSDGSSVNWTEVPAAGSAVEPEHAAPTLSLGAAKEDNPVVAPSSATNSMQTASSKSSSTAVPTGIAIAAAVIALVALVFALRRPKSANALVGPQMERV